MENKTAVNVGDINVFANKVRETVLKTFLLTFHYDERFIDVYDESLLTAATVRFWIDYHTFFDDNGSLMIYEYDVAILERNIYIEFIEALMSRLVDNGVLKMCWDSDKEQVTWEKI